MIFNMTYDTFMQHAQYQISSSLNLLLSALDYSLMCYCHMLINHCSIILKIKHKRTLTVEMLYFLLQSLLISRSSSDYLFICWWHVESRLLWVSWFHLSVQQTWFSYLIVNQDYDLLDWKMRQQWSSRSLRLENNILQTKYMSINASRLWRCLSFQYQSWWSYH